MAFPDLRTHRFLTLCLAAPFAAWCAKPLPSPTKRFEAALHRLGLYESKLLPTGCLSWKSTPFGKDSLRFDPVIAPKKTCEDLRAKDSWILPLDGTEPLLVAGSDQGLRVSLEEIEELAESDPAELEDHGVRAGRESEPGPFVGTTEEDGNMIDVILAGGGGAIRKTRAVKIVGISRNWTYFDPWEHITHGEVSSFQGDLPPRREGPTDSATVFELRLDGLRMGGTVLSPVGIRPNTGLEAFPDSVWKDSLVAPLGKALCALAPDRSVRIVVHPDLPFSLLSGVLRTAAGAGRTEVQLAIGPLAPFAVELLQRRPGGRLPTTWLAHSCDSAGSDVLASVGPDSTVVWKDLVAGRPKYQGLVVGASDTLTPKESDSLGGIIRSALGKPGGRWMGVLVEPEVRISRLGQVATLVPKGRRIALYGAFRGRTRLAAACPDRR